MTNNLPFSNLAIGLEKLDAFLNKILSSKIIIEFDFLTCET